MYFDLLLFQVIAPFSEDEKQAGTLRSTVNQTQDDMVNTRNGGNNEDNDIDEESSQDRLDYFCCPDLSCKKVFARATSLEKHICIGNHSYHSDKSGMDTAAEVYADRCESIRTSQLSLVQSLSVGTDSTDLSLQEMKGWALKGKRTSVRFSEKVKTYLNKICLTCEKTGKRPDYVALADEIRKSCDEQGERVFKKAEWLNQSQLKSYMASFLIKLKTKSETLSTLHVQLKEIPNEEVDQDETLSEIIAVLETNDYNSNIENIVEEVYTAVNI